MENKLICRGRGIIVGVEKIISHSKLLELIHREAQTKFGPHNIIT
jgi:hypothetical protein